MNFLEGCWGPAQWPGFSGNRRCREGEAGMVKRREHRQIGRFQFRLPVDMPRLDPVTKTQFGVRSMSIGRSGFGAFLMQFRPRWPAPLPGGGGSLTPQARLVTVQRIQSTVAAAAMHLRAITSPSCRPPPHLNFPQCLRLRGLSPAAAYRLRFLGTLRFMTTILPSSLQPPLHARRYARGDCPRCRTK